MVIVYIEVFVSCMIKADIIFKKVYSPIVNYKCKIVLQGILVLFQCSSQQFYKICVLLTFYNECMRIDKDYVSFSKVSFGTTCILMFTIFII